MCLCRPVKICDQEWPKWCLVYQTAFRPFPTLLNGATAAIPTKIFFAHTSSICHDSSKSVHLKMSPSIITISVWSPLASRRHLIDLQHYQCILQKHWQSLTVHVKLMHAWFPPFRCHSSVAVSPFPLAVAYLFWYGCNGTEFSYVIFIEQRNFTTVERRNGKGRTVTEWWKPGIRQLQTQVTENKTFSKLQQSALMSIS